MENVHEKLQCYWHKNGENVNDKIIHICYTSQTFVNFITTLWLIQIQGLLESMETHRVNLTVCVWVQESLMH